MALDQLDKDGPRHPPAAVEQNEEPVSVEESGLPREVYALLAQANLLRMRGGWDEAVQNCMAALRLAPDSPSAQSLLGDIYENQGRYDDAIQWYRMALDINPDSPADQMKLDRLLGLQRKQRRRSWQQQSVPESPLADEERPVVSTDLDPIRHSWRFQHFLPSTDMALRYGAMTAALLVLLIVAFAYVSIHRHAALASLGLASDQEVKTHVVVLPTTNAPTPSYAPDKGAHDAAEQAVLEALRASQALKSQEITILDVQTDPRSAAIRLTFGLMPPAGGSLSRDTVLRAAFLTAHAATLVPIGQTAATITVRCLLTSAGTEGGASLIFVGDLPRSSLSTNALPEAGLDAVQLQARFVSPWWSSQIPD